MKNVLIRQSVFREGAKTYNDLEVEVSEVIIGTEASSTVILHGQGVEGRHVVMSLNKEGTIRASSGGKHTIDVNGEAVRKATLSDGDTVSIGGHSVVILPTPPGFDLAIQVDLAPGDSGRLDESRFRTDIGDVSISTRGPAWALAILVLATFLVIPILSGLQDGEGGDIEMPALLTDQAWSSGDLHPAHALAIGDDCSACHVTPFSRVADTVCEECHKSVTLHASDSLMAEQGHQMERCGSCHREHDEPHAMIDDSGSDCESCHSVSSLAGDHPEFTDYPNPERPRIIFDHTSHDLKHFVKTERDFECSSCHRLDPAGQHQIIASFDDMCVDCHGGTDDTAPDRVYHHGDQVATSDPVVVFSLPALDLRTLGEVPGLGAWPEDTRKGVRNGITRLGLTPFVELLLSTDPVVAAALSRLREDKVKLKALKGADEQRVADVISVIWSLKLLIDELDFYPADSVLRHRLAPVVPRELGRRELSALSGQLGTGTVDNAVDLWFRGESGEGIALSTDIQRAGKDTIKHSEADPGKALGDIPGLPGVLTGQWTEDKFALHYIPSGHLDSFLHAWLELTMELKQTLTPATDGGFGPREAAEALYEELADAGADAGKAQGAGRCTKCHSEIIDQDGLRRIAWRSLEADPLIRRYTHYLHADHVGDDKVEICVDCHVQAKDSDILSAYKDEASAMEFVSNFQPLTIDTCSGCHAPEQQSSDTCVTCHRYHVAEPRQSLADNSGVESEPRTE